MLRKEIDDSEKHVVRGRGMTAHPEIKQALRNVEKTAQLFGTAQDLGRSGERARMYSASHFILQLQVEGDYEGVGARALEPNGPIQ